MKTAKKIVGLKKLKNIVAGLRRKKVNIAFTNGCFDILHLGHVSYLEKSKNEDRVLIVAINSDASVKKIKGPKRPIVPEGERAQIIAALSCVDFVTIFNEPTPIKVIEAVKPDILIKGADWKGKEIVGADVVKKNGGRVEFIKFLNDHSTTNIIETVLKTCVR